MSILVGDKDEAPGGGGGASQEAVKACAGPCGRTLPLSSFSVNAARQDGRQRLCKECHRAARGPRGRAALAALSLERELSGLLDDYEVEPSLSDVLSRALEEVRQIGATGDKLAAQVEAVRHAVLIHGCRRVAEVVEEERLSRWAVEHALAELVGAGVLETRDAFRLGEEAEEAGRPVTEYHPRAYPRGEGFSRLFRRQDAGDELEVEP
jgi:hypothetical protein